MAISPGGRPADASPLGKKGGQRQLDDYVREVAHALMRHGHDESSAIAIAKASIAKWAEGRGRVRPQVSAGAAAALIHQKLLDHSRRGHRG